MPQSPRDNLQECAGEDSTWSSPSKISRKVRELAHQSHRALKVVSQPHVLNPKVSQETSVDLNELRGQVARLQQKIHDRRLGVLVPWVDALRRQLEDRLGNSGSADVR